MPRTGEYKIAIPDLRALLAQGWGTGEIARKYGLNYKSVWWRIRKEGIPFQPSRKGRHNGAWKGGRVKSGNYIYFYYPEHPFATKHGKVLESRIAMELKLNRYLLPSEVVHHKKGYSNHPDNLEVFATNGEHLAATLKGKIPKWTVDGRRRILEAVHQAHKNRKRANRAKSKKHVSR